MAADIDAASPLMLPTGGLLLHDRRYLPAASEHSFAALSVKGCESAWPVSCSSFSSCSRLCDALDLMYTRAVSACCSSFVWDDEQTVLSTSSKAMVLASVIGRAPLRQYSANDDQAPGGRAPTDENPLTWSTGCKVLAGVDGLVPSASHEVSLTSSSPSQVMSQRSLPKCNDVGVAQAMSTVDSDDSSASALFSSIHS